MSRSYKFHNPEGLYFVSFAVVDWMDVFTRVEYKEIAVESLKFCQANKGMEIYAWCIMSNHIHLVFRSIKGEQPELLLGDYKRFTSQTIVKTIIASQTESRKDWMLQRFSFAARRSSNVKHYQFWRHDNQPIELSTNAMIDQKIDYVHQNPVVAGWVAEPQEYLYSSARDYAGLKGLIDGIVLAC
jgi:REP element-mobilizing transposase RayT